MVNKFLKNIAAGVESIYGFACDTLEAIIEPIADDEVDMPEESIPAVSYTHLTLPTNSRV